MSKVPLATHGTWCPLQGQEHAVCALFYLSLLPFKKSVHRWDWLSPDPLPVCVCVSLQQDVLNEDTSEQQARLGDRQNCLSGSGPVCPDVFRPVINRDTKSKSKQVGSVWAPVSSFSAHHQNWSDPTMPSGADWNQEFTTFPSDSEDQL